MKNTFPKSRRVAGVKAPSARPTPLGAALVAAAVTLPIGVTVLIVDLLLL